MRPLFLLAFVACGGVTDVPDGGGDAAIDHYGHKNFDAAEEAAYDAPEEEAAVKVPWDRMSSHEDVIVASPKIRVLYVGLTKNSDELVSWMVTSKTYWPILAQYGVGPGEFLGSTSIDQDAFFQPNDVQGGFIDSWTLGDRIRTAVAAFETTSDAGVANAWVVFLPGGVNVDLGDGKTCQWALGYHWWYDGNRPYSVIPDCGSSGWTVSHEIAEMVTDPTGFGWYSDADVQNAGGEIGDLCNFPVTVEGHTVTALWSNADGDCEPPQ
jgi:hypothetical protein